MEYDGNAIVWKGEMNNLSPHDLTTIRIALEQRRAHIHRELEAVGGDSRYREYLHKELANVCHVLDNHVDIAERNLSNA